MDHLDRTINIIKPYVYKMLAQASRGMRHYKYFRHALIELGVYETYIEDLIYTKFCTLDARNVSISRIVRYIERRLAICDGQIEDGLTTYICFLTDTQAFCLWTESKMDRPFWLDIKNKLETFPIKKNTE